MTCDECNNNIEKNPIHIEHLIFCSNKCANKYRQFLNSKAFKK